MKRCLALALAAAMAAAPVAAGAADCYADYKAKQDNPLRLHYGVIRLQGSCTIRSAQQEAAARLSAAGWTLLNVMTVFGPEGLEQRKANAGTYFLRF